MPSRPLSPDEPHKQHHERIDLCDQPTRPLEIKEETVSLIVNPRLEQDCQHHVHNGQNAEQSYQTPTRNSEQPRRQTGGGHLLRGQNVLALAIAVTVRAHPQHALVRDLPPRRSKKERATRALVHRGLSPIPRCLRGADRVPGTRTLWAYRAPHGAGWRRSVQQAEGSADLVASSEDPVVTGFQAIRCNPGASDAMVSERGLEPPRPSRALGPQPSISVNIAAYSRGLRAPSRRHATHRATNAAMLTPSEVPARVPGSDKVRRRSSVSRSGFPCQRPKPMGATALSANSLPECSVEERRHLPASDRIIRAEQGPL